MKTLRKTNILSVCNLLSTKSQSLSPDSTRIILDAYNLVHTFVQPFIFTDESKLAKLLSLAKSLYPDLFQFYTLDYFIREK